MRRTSIAVLSILLLSSVFALAESPQTRLPLTGRVLAVVSASELDVMVTRSSISDVVSSHTLVRVVYHGLLTPGRFDSLYMEAYDLNWILTSDREIYFEPADTLWDDEGRLHAFVYLDPNGFGMMNAFLLSSGLATLDPSVDPEETNGQLLIDIAAAAARSGVGAWEKADEPEAP
jgi:hypothetical protein